MSNNSGVNPWINLKECAVFNEALVKSSCRERVAFGIGSAIDSVNTLVNAPTLSAIRDLTSQLPVHQYLAAVGPSLQMDKLDPFLAVIPGDARTMSLCLTDSDLVIPAIKQLNLGPDNLSANQSITVCNSELPLNNVSDINRLLLAVQTRLSDGLQIGCFGQMINVNFMVPSFLAIHMLNLNDETIPDMVNLAYHLTTLPTPLTEMRLALFDRSGQTSAIAYTFSTDRCQTSEKQIMVANSNIKHISAAEFLATATEQLISHERQIRQANQKPGLYLIGSLKVNQ